MHAKLLGYFNRFFRTPAAENALREEFYSSCLVNDLKKVEEILAKHPEAANWHGNAEDDFDEWTQQSRGLRNAILYDATEVAMILLKKGANPNTLSDVTPVFVMAAETSGNEELIQAFIDAGVDVNIAARNQPDYTALSAAVLNNHLSYIPVLVEKGADTSHVSSPAVDEAVRQLALQKASKDKAVGDAIRQEMASGLQTPLVLTAPPLQLKAPRRR